jgi:serine/threonine protein kinase
VELFTGSLFYKTRKNDYEHLAMIEKQCGPIPLRLVNAIRNPEVKLLFNVNGTNTSHLIPTTEDIRIRVQGMKGLDQIFHKSAHAHLKDLIKKMMVILPEHRITAVDALQHPFFKHT